MCPDSPGNDWNEYRRMIIDWHEQEVTERREIRERLEKQEVAVNTKLDAIALQLAAIHGERKFKQYAFSIIIPAIVSLLVLGGDALVAALIK